MRLASILAATAITALIASATTSHAQTYSGVVTGTWSNPILSGIGYDGATGAPLSFNNTTTAACNISGCPNGVGVSLGSTTLAWGINPTSSTLNTNGHLFTDIPLNTPFDALGLTFFNGTSDLSTIIFGATLNLTFGNSNISPLSIPIQIVTTANTGTTNQQNADWVGPFGTPTTQTMNVFEGANGQAELWGEFVLDPQFQPTLLLTNDPNTFIGNGLPAAPEPSTWAMMLIGFAGLGFAGYRQARRRAITA